MSQEQSIPILVHLRLGLSHRSETNPVDENVRRTGSDEEDGLGYVRRTEHVGPGDEPVAAIGIDRIPHRGVRRTRGHQRQPDAGPPVLRQYVSCKPRSAYLLAAYAAFSGKPT